LKNKIIVIFCAFLCSCSNLEINKENKERGESGDVTIKHCKIENIYIKSATNKPYDLESDKITPDFSETGIQLNF
jgi:hypothetical protein